MLPLVSNPLRWLMFPRPSTRNTTESLFINIKSAFHAGWHEFSLSVSSYQLHFDSHSRVFRVSLQQVERRVARNGEYWFVLQLVFISPLRAQTADRLRFHEVLQLKLWTQIAIIKWKQRAVTLFYLFGLLKTSNWPPGVLRGLYKDRRMLLKRVETHKSDKNEKWFC